MKIASSLKSLKKRDLNSKLVRRRGRVYIINKKILNLKQDKNNMDNKVIKTHGITLQSLYFELSCSSNSSCFNGNISSLKNDYWFYF